MLMISKKETCTQEKQKFDKKISTEIYLGTMVMYVSRVNHADL